MLKRLMRAFERDTEARLRVEVMALQDSLRAMQATLLEVARERDAWRSRVLGALGLAMGVGSPELARAVEAIERMRASLAGWEVFLADLEGILASGTAPAWGHRGDVLAMARKVRDRRDRWRARADLAEDSLRRVAGLLGAGAGETAEGAAERVSQTIGLLMRELNETEAKLEAARSEAVLYGERLSAASSHLDEAGAKIALLEGEIATFGERLDEERRRAAHGAALNHAETRIRDQDRRLDEAAAEIADLRRCPPLVWVLLDAQGRVCSVWDSEHGAMGRIAEMVAIRAQDDAGDALPYQAQAWSVCQGGPAPTGLAALAAREAGI